MTAQEAADAGADWLCALSPEQILQKSGALSPNFWLRGVVVTCVYVNPELGQWCIVNYRIFDKAGLVKLFRIIASNEKFEYIATNDRSSRLSSEDVKSTCALRWKIEQFHRELKQLTGLEKCQCRKRRIQRNHIASAMLAWIRLNQAARAIGSTAYQIKQGLLREYLLREMRQPAVPIALA